METLLLAKLLVTVTVVVALSLVAEYASPRLSGLLAGFPHGVAIVLFFIGMEQGADFAAAAAVYTLAGLAANAGFAWGYWKALHLIRRMDMPLAPLAALAVFFMLSAIFSHLPLDVWTAAALAFAVIALVGWQVRHEEDVTISRKVRIGWREVLARAFGAAAIVMTITALAHVIGPEWSGLLAGFPIVTFPFLIIIHAEHGRAPLHTILKAYPAGLGSLVVFALVVSFAYTALGMAGGTLAGLLAAAAWLIIFQHVRRRLAVRSR